MTDGCPAVFFVDMQPDPNNSAYADPFLEAICTATHLVIDSNNMPDFEFVSITPNALTPQEVHIELPLEPVMFANPTDVPLGGPTGITVNGLLIFGPTEAPQAGYRDPVLDEILDFCNGHTAPGGIYHHASPTCLVGRLGGGQVGLVIGYAFDGLPILAPYVCADSSCGTMVELQSSWEIVDPNVTNAWEMHSYVEGAGDLDACNGIWLENGTYAYVAASSFPYFMGCFMADYAVTEPVIDGGRP